MCIRDRDYDYRWVDANGIASEHFGEVTTSETVNKMSFTPSVNAVSYTHLNFSFSAMKKQFFICT